MKKNLTKKEFNDLTSIADDIQRKILNAEDTLPWFV